MGQETDEHLQQSTLKGGREGGRRWIEPRRQVKSSRDTCTEVERLREGHLQKIDESDKERERHLRRYHQQLQQFMPSSASSSDHLLSPSTCLSFSSSNPVSLSSSVPPSSCSSLQHSPLKYHGLEEVCRARVKIRTDGSRGQLSSFPRGGICLQTVTSPSYSNNKDEAGRGDSGGSEDWRACLEGTEAGFGQDRGKGEKRRSLKVRVEGEVRGRREDWRPAGKEEGGERKWAWVATAHTEQADKMTGARPADVEAQVFYDRDSEVGEEGPDASAVTADGVWSAEERGGDDGYALVSSHSNNDSSSLFDNSPVESPHQRAPAERPLSPACEHTNTLLTPNKLSDLSLELKHTRCTSNTLSPLIQNAQQGVPSSRDRELQFAANANRREFSNAQSVTLPLTIPFTQNGCKIPAKPLNILSENPAHTQAHDHPDVKAEMPVLSQGETSTDSVSCTMDPLSISLLQVDQEVATASFLQAEQNNTSLCPLENERAEDKKREVEKEGLTCAEMAGKVVEDEDVEFCLSLLELPQAMTHCPPTSHHMTATDHSEQRKDECFATCEYCGIGMMKPPIPEIRLVSLQDQENYQKPQTTPAIEVMDNKAPASPLKPSTWASMGISVMQSVSSSVQPSGNTGSPSLMTNGATQIPLEYAHGVHDKIAFSISTPQSESVLGQVNTLQKRCHTVHSNHSSISPQPNNSTESNCEESTGNLQLRNITNLSMLEDLYHSQWRVVQAHWEQLEEMETLCRKEGVLLCQQPDMAFGEYVHKLGEIMERKARCVHSMIAQLQPYLKTSHCNQPHNPGEDNHDKIT
ncbi:uncharacterized protein LOC121606931 [Chelmon rostratus]|uniref:uncharacterized protein LOC121606931 n=1 Tax=Chelmon rostratus TaxID=109905 RepID=UPI001BE83691|nr:uncharacterized protein LOC121606931 [Chelmon rostratus]